jgi:molybdenum cofactor biosynthesis protein B
VTVSSSRYQKEKEGQTFKDESGDLAGKIIRKRGHTLEKRSLIPDEGRLITKAVKEFLNSKSDAIVFMGGTGVSSRDVTIETVRPHFEKELEGFGELFRAISFKRIGTAAALSRATAGICRGRLLLCLPGSPDAVKTALELFLAELPHVIHVARS